MHAMHAMPCMLCAPPPPQAAPCNVCPSPYIRSCARTGLAQDLDTRARPRGPSRIRRPENSEERVLRSNPYEKRRFPPPRQACQRHEYVWYALLPARYASFYLLWYARRLLAYQSKKKEERNISARAGTYFSAACGVCTNSAVTSQPPTTNQPVRARAHALADMLLSSSSCFGMLGGS